MQYCSTTSESDEDSSVEQDLLQPQAGRTISAQTTTALLLSWAAGQHQKQPMALAELK